MIFVNVILLIVIINNISSTPIGQGVQPTSTGCNVCGGNQQNPVGSWSSWSEWGTCQSYSGTYGQVRTRQCQGSGCVGGNEEARHCTPPSTGNGGGCNVCGTGNSGNGVWSNWSEWSLCEETSQGPVQKRTRQCLSGSCQGYNQETESCIQYSQPSTPEWENWSSWSQCSATCGGGVQTRTRQCDTQCGVCQCSGNNQETQQCNTQACCTWGQWGSWSPCSNSCGTGQRNRVRSCSCLNCNGEAYQQEVCTSTSNCPVQNNPPTCNTCQQPVVATTPTTCSTCGPLVNQPQVPSTCSTCSSSSGGGAITAGGIIG
uniref:Uncharacterized protein n=1 Tax=Parastrongyloides trichosuri TaxID=131310 RepID=A0A0N4Z5A2_PARTI